MEPQASDPDSLVTSAGEEPTFLWWPLLMEEPLLSTHVQAKAVVRSRVKIRRGRQNDRRHSCFSRATESKIRSMHCMCSCTPCP